MTDGQTYQSQTYQVLLFGPQAQMVGAREVSVQLQADSTTVADVLAALRQQVPALKESLAVSRLAVNQDYACGDDQVSAADELALIGMVSGG